MLLTWPAYVLQRRLNIPFAHVEQVLFERPVTPGTALARGGESPIVFDGAFHRVPTMLGAPPAWRAPARLEQRRRCIARVEIELSIWDNFSTELLLRPTATHPERWGPGRTQRYFDAAHEAADATLLRLSEGARGGAAPVEAPRHGAHEPVLASHREN
jgi:hypothetical protein